MTTSTHPTGRPGSSLGGPLSLGCFRRSAPRIRVGYRPTPARLAALFDEAYPPDTDVQATWIEARQRAGAPPAAGTTATHRTNAVNS